VRVMKRLPVAVALATIAAAAAAEPPQTGAAGSIPDYRLLQPGLATAGEPAPEVLAKLKETGFRTVVNLRTEQEGAAEEAKVVEGEHGKTVDEALAAGREAGLRSPVLEAAVRRPLLGSPAPASP
jgi:hypothetical protein